MSQFELLVENLKCQSEQYRELKPIMSMVRGKAERSTEELLEAVRRSQNYIDAVSRLADERRILENRLAEALDLETFERDALEGVIPSNCLEAFDEQVRILTGELTEALSRQRENVQIMNERKKGIGVKLFESSIGKQVFRTYYMKDREASFIDKKSR